jgi:hypothetical protein
MGNINALKLPCALERAQERCLMANVEPCVVSDVAVITIKIHSFT